MSFHFLSKVRLSQTTDYHCCVVSYPIDQERQLTDNVLQNGLPLESDFIKEKCKSSIDIIVI
jgi:hypothetical protein